MTERKDGAQRTLALLLFTVAGLAPAAVHAQQPFYTDDADVTPPRKFHIEISNEFDILQRSAYPNLRQNTVVFRVNYGLLEKVEVGIDAPLIAIFGTRDRSPQVAFGIGDTDFSIKYNVRKERADSALPALALNFRVEVPTGSTRRQLGSGLADYWLTGIVQKSLTERTTLRVNSGLLFSGNTLTGVIGVNARGRVFTGGVSLVRKMTAKLELGGEVTGAATRQFSLQKKQLQALIGGKYAVRDRVSVDFGVVGGRYTASPRVGVQLGLSMDF